MAQSAIPGPSSAQSDGRNGIAKEHLYELEQYEKIIRLRDAVLAGTHPTIKVPPELLAQATSGKVAGNLGLQAHPSGAALAQSQGTASPHDIRVAGAPSSGTDSGTKRSAPEINPIFLEKSEHLVRAELKLQRQRAERALRDEVEQRRPAKNATSDFSTDIDIPDVLSKALAIVPALPATTPAVPDPTANSDKRSDSFDDNTFYSSQHDTPDLRSSPSRRDVTDHAGASRAALDDSDEANEDIYDPASPADHAPDPVPPEHRSQVVAAPSSLSRPAATVPGLNNYTDQSISSSRSADQQSQDRIFPPGLGRVEQMQTVHHGAPGPTGRPLATEAYAEAHPPSPLLRTHDLHPIAPQPAQHATLPIDSSASNSGAPTATGTPAQVAALRNDPMSATSPDSSPQGGRVPERKRSKKKKRKADRQAAEADPVFVKPEPRSPSPMAAPSYIRPSKRARHAHRQAQGPGSAYLPTAGAAPGYDTPDYDTAVSSGRPSGAPPLIAAQGEPVPISQARSGHYPPRPGSSAMHGPRRYSGGYVEARGRVAHPAGYGAYPQPPYGFQEPPEIIYDYMDGSEGYPRAVSHHIPHEGSRMSLRPEGSTYMGAPRSQPQRIYVDSTGREYLEPRRPIVRQSVAPAGYYREPEVVYERAPPRGVSNYAEARHYMEAGPPYGSTAQAYPAGRRVVTQPEYVQQSPYGETYQSDYPRRSMIPPDVRAAEPPGQDFLTRSASVRPAQPRPPPPQVAPVAGEYASSQDYGSGPDSRMETVVRGYGQATAVGRQTPAQAYAWEYEAGPALHPGGHTAPGPAYYAAPARDAEEIAFIEQPRGVTQDVVYTSSGREDLYR